MRDFFATFPLSYIHVSIMLTRGRAQRLVLKAAEPEGLEAYRLLLRRYEPVSTVTTVPELVDLLATTFSGDLMDSWTYFQRRVTSWEHEAKETVVRFDQNRSCHQRFGEGWFRESFAHQHCWHDRMDEICERDRQHVELARRNTTACSDGFVGDGQSGPTSSRVHRSWWATYAHMARDCRKKTENMQNKQTIKRVANPVKGKGGQDKGNDKGKLSKGKGKSKSKGKGKQHGKERNEMISRNGGARRQTRNTNRSSTHRVEGHELGSR